MSDSGKKKAGRPLGSKSRREVDLPASRRLELLTGAGSRNSLEREFKRIYKGSSKVQQSRIFKETIAEANARPRHTPDAPTPEGPTIILSMDGVSRKSAEPVSCPKCKNIFVPYGERDGTPEGEEEETPTDRVRGKHKPPPASVRGVHNPHPRYQGPPHLADLAPRAYRIDTLEEIQADQESEAIREKSGVRNA